MVTTYDRCVVRTSTILLTLVLLSAIPVVAGAQSWKRMLGIEQSENSIAWSYQGSNGPDHWADLGPEFTACDEGNQSPIDIRGGQAFAFRPLSFRYRSCALSISNEGNGLRLTYCDGSYLVTGGREYELKEVRFHVPSEHWVSGEAADMEMQLIHRDRHGRIAAVGVLMLAGRHMNSTMTRIWDNLPRSAGETLYNRQIGINPLFMLPNQRSYFSYKGSLTQPPCTEGVQWFVLTEPLEVDLSYVKRLRSIIGANARPVQPTNGREVLTVFRR